MVIDDKLKLLEISKKQQGMLYIVGAGKFGNVFGKWLGSNQIDYQGYIDQKKEGDLNGKPIYQTVPEKNKQAFFLISSWLFQAELIGQLLDQGVKEENILSLHGSGLQYAVYEEVSDWKTYTKRNECFEGKHRDLDRCFIIGNGPSLRIEDLEKLKDEITFASNMIYALYKSTLWRPTYYCAMDSSFCKKMMSDKESMNKITSGCQAAFTSVIGEGFQFRDDPEMQNLYYLAYKRSVDRNTNSPYFSDDSSKEIYVSGTVTYALLQLAVYMGFKKIYLLGVDCTFSVERHKNGSITVNHCVNHMDEIEEERKKFNDQVKDRFGYSYLADIDLQIAGYEAAKKYADSRGIKIYNATRGGKLEVFERVDFDCLF